MTRIVDVFTAAPSQESAQTIVESAVSAGLAAGGQVAGPVASFFWHAGEFGRGEEWKVSLRTTAERYPDLEAHLIANHPWSNPEIVGTTLTHASAAYVEWVQRSTAQQVSHGG